MIDFRRRLFNQAIQNGAHWLAMTFSFTYRYPTLLLGKNNQNQRQNHSKMEQNTWNMEEYEGVGNYILLLCMFSINCCNMGIFR